MNLPVPDNNILETILSITLIYAMLSVLVSILVEARNYKTKARAKMLRESITQLLRDPHNQEYGELFYNHFMITGLKSTHNRPPQYISSAMFADVLIDIIARQAEHTRDIQLVKSGPDGKVYTMVPETGDDKIPDDLFGRFKYSLGKMHPSPFRDLLISFCQKSEGKYEKLKPVIENWYNDYMDRVSGWYKTKQRTKFLYFGFAVAFLLNIDSIHLVRMISMDDTLRARLVATAENVADNYNDTSAVEKTNAILIEKLSHSLPEGVKKDSLLKHPKTFIAFMQEKAPAKVKELMTSVKDSVEEVYARQTDSILSIIAALDIPIGWSNESAPYTWVFPIKETCGCEELSSKKGLMTYVEKHNHCPSFVSWLWYLLGISITGISLSFGAPFWFEMLVKLVNIRRAGAKPKTSTDSKS